MKAQEATGFPDAGNLNPAFGVEAQWDSDARVRVLEGEGGSLHAGSNGHGQHTVRRGRATATSTTAHPELPS